MDLATFEFDAAAVAAATDDQRAALGLLADVIRRVRPSELEVAEVTVNIEGASLAVFLPHRADDDQHLGLQFGEDDVIVLFGSDHLHLDVDPAIGPPWPVDAPDVTAAAVEMIERFLLGRAVIAVHHGPVVRSSRCSWIDATDERQLFLRDGTVQLRRRRDRPRDEEIRFDFGARPC